MVNIYLAAGRQAPTKPIDPPDDVPDLTFMSLDGSRSIVVNGESGWTHLPGATGLEMPPIDIVTSAVPGIPGSVLGEVRVEERPIFIPLDAASPDYRRVTHQAMLDSLRDLVDPTRGEFYVVCGDRRLRVIYTDGLQGSFGKDEFGLYWRKFGLKALASQPYAEDLEVRELPFRISTQGRAFLGRANYNDAPWGTRSLTSSAVISEDMKVLVESEVEVFPELDLVGPMDSFEGTVVRQGAPAGERPWWVSVPQGVPQGQTLRLVTDPRARSIRLGPGDASANPDWTGELAAGRVARGSHLRPFYPGTNLMSVAAPGGTGETRIFIRWRSLRRSLW